MRAKVELKPQMLNEAIGRCPSETNLTESDQFDCSGIAGSYRYQRFDFRVDPVVSAQRIYGALESDGYTVATYLASCGMGAIAATMSAAKRTFGGIKTDRPSDSYFETRKLLEDYIDTPLASPNVLLVDSISAADGFDFLERSLTKQTKLVIIDTTCYSTYWSRLRQMQCLLKRRQLPYVLVRSHMKLDNLGMEYFRLGSAVLCFPSKSATGQLLSQYIPDALARYGANASPLAIPPFFWNADFWQLSERRSRQIEICNAIGAEELRKRLDESSLEITAFHHNKFFSVHSDRWTNQAQITARKKLLGKILVQNGIAARSAASFGFDFVALDNYRDAATGREALRISLPDFSIQNLSQFVKIATAFFTTEEAAAARQADVKHGEEEEHYDGTTVFGLKRSSIVLN